MLEGKTDLLLHYLAGVFLIVLGGVVLVSSPGRYGFVRHSALENSAVSLMQIGSAPKLVALISNSLEPAQTGFGSVFQNIIAPAKSIPPQFCDAKQGQIVIQQIETDLLRQPLEFRIYLPPCYDQTSAERYPLLILIHGQGFTDDQWERLGVASAADRLINSKQVVPFIILMPRDRSWGQPSQDPFGKALVTELIPWVDERYKTIPDRQHRAIGGLSRGAAWAVHLGLSEWRTFNAVGAHSLPVFYSDTRLIPKWLDAIPLKQRPVFFLDIGERDRPEIMDAAVWFEELLTDRYVPHEWYLYPGYHEEAYWGSHVEQYLRWYASTW